MDLAPIKGGIRTYLSGVSLDRAFLEATDFSNSTIQSGRFVQANLINTNWENALLKGADLQAAHLGSVRNLTCKQLKSAKNWEKTYRPEELACGAKIVSYRDIWKPNRIVGWSN